MAWVLLIFSLWAADPRFWGDARWLMLLGIERLAQNDFREAIPLFEMTSRLRPNSPLVHAWLANAFHMQRRLDEAATHYHKLLELDPVLSVDAARREAILRYAPRLFQVPSDPFRLLDAVAIHHPDEPLIAYHFFWEDDIDFPSDNDPCDHELVWVRYDPESGKLAQFYTYFHGRILSSPAAVAEASEHKGRPRVNVQWGKHGSLPHGWESLPVQANAGDIERKYLDLERPRTLREYNLATYQKLHREGREQLEHARTASWPVRFEGSWEDFTRFERELDLRSYFSEHPKMVVSRWNNVALQQNLLAYNFRPKTEWPDRHQSAAKLEAQTERRIGSGSNQLLDQTEAVALRKEASIDPDPFLVLLGQKGAGSPFELPPATVFPETPRYPNIWLYAPAERFPAYISFVHFLEDRFRQGGYDVAEVGLNEGADLALSIEHLQPWDALEGLRHAHAIHIRFFWKRLERNSLHKVESRKGQAGKLFWRVAASVHYEVEHAHPLHADVEVCPFCGRTGSYAAKTGNLVERVHDPLGVELLIDGRIRGEVVRTSDGKNFRALKDLVPLREQNIFLTSSYRKDMNTEAIAVTIIDD